MPSETLKAQLAASRLSQNATEMLDILEFAIETEEGNWDGPKDEPEWMKQARAVIRTIRSHERYRLHFRRASSDA